MNCFFSCYRYYDSKVGRFLQSDTVTPSPESKGLNRYTYVNNSPTNSIDPDGHIPQDATRRNVKTYKEAQNELLAQLGYTGNAESSVAMQQDEAQTGSSQEEITHLSPLAKRHHEAQATFFGVRTLMQNHDIHHVVKRGDDVKALHKVRNASLSLDMFLEYRGAVLSLMPRMSEARALSFHLGMPFAEFAYLHELQDLNSGATLGTTFREGYELGFTMGRAQIPVASSTRPTAHFPEVAGFNMGYHSGLRLPGYLGVGGAFAGVLGSLQSDNPYIKSFGLGAAAVEGYGALRVVQISSFYSQPSMTIGTRTLGVLARGRKALSFGGWGGVAVWVIDELDRVGTFDRGTPETNRAVEKEIDKRVPQGFGGKFVKPQNN